METIHVCFPSHRNNLHFLPKLQNSPSLSCTCSGGALSRVTLLAEWLRYFNDLAVGGDRGSRMFFAGERGGGRNATAAKSLK
jgi:hypothetical protein